MPAPTTDLPERPLVAIIDDDASVREALCELLAAMDIRCREFDRAEAFLMNYRAGAFDCLLTDVRMPGMSGLELQDRLRAIQASVPVIFVSADTSSVTQARAISGGAVAYLIKPINAEVLYRHLRRFVIRGSGGFPEASDE